MLNWIVWNRTVYKYKNGFGIKYPTMVDMPLNKKKQNQDYAMLNPFLYTEQFYF